ncbi:MAG: PQQ-binding-like beta-propeller repeat protein [bacterium]
MRHDTRQTGQSPYLGVQTNYLKWSYTTGASILSSPAIGSDGTVYVGSSDGRLYAFLLK